MGVQWEQQFSMKRVSVRFSKLKLKDESVVDFYVDDKIPDNGETIWEILAMFPNLEILQGLDKLKTPNQFFLYGDTSPNWSAEWHRRSFG